MSQISVHNETAMATIHSSHPSGGTEAMRHLAAVLRLLRCQDQLKMMVRLEPFIASLAWEANRTRYLAVVSTRCPTDYRTTGSQNEASRGGAFVCESSSSSSTSSKDQPPEEVCILGIDVTGPVNPRPPMTIPHDGVVPGEETTAAAAAASVLASSASAPAVPQKAQRSHSTVSPDHHQSSVGSRIASRARKFLTLPKQKNQMKPVSPAPRLAKRPSISSSVTVKLGDLPRDTEEDSDGTVHIGLVLPIWADSKISLDGDGGFRIESKDRQHSFKPVSVQAMWSVLQTLLKASENAKRHHQLSPAAIGSRHYHQSVSTNVLSTLTSTGTRDSTLTMSDTCHQHSASTSAVSLSTDHPCFTMGSHGWVVYYSTRIDSQWVKEWHLNLDDFQHFTNDVDGASSARRPLSPHMSTHRQQTYSATETKIRQNLREVMMKLDLEQVNSKEIRKGVENNLKMDLSAFKSFIDHEILVILGQMDAASEIFDFLYLGTEWNAGNMDELKEKDIGLVVNVTTEINNSFPGNFVYKNIRVNDVEEEPMVKHWEDAFRYISEAKKEKKRVLVHCKMGVSRSASVVIAYAMKANDWNLQQAMDFVKKRRSVVQPNPGFLKQLEEYEGMLEASKHRTSFQSLSGSTLSLCDTRPSKNSTGMELDEFLSYSNLSRSQSEFCSTPNLAPSVPQRTESLRLSSRPAKFYLENSDDDMPDKLRHNTTTTTTTTTTTKQLTKKGSNRKSRTVKWDPIEEVTVKEDPDDVFGMFRVVDDTQSVPTSSSIQPTGSSADLHDTSSYYSSSDKNRSVSLSETSSSHSQSARTSQQSTATSSIASVSKVKVRQNRSSFSASSVFGLPSSVPANAPPQPAKEQKYSAGSSSRRPASIHVSSYLKPKDPVQTLVKYFDEMHTTRSPHAHVVATSPAMQAAHV